MRIITILLVTLLSFSTSQQCPAEDSQNANNQLVMLKTIYDTPLDRLEEMCAPRTSAEIEQIKAREYLRRETARNIMKNQQLNPTQANQIAELIRSEEDFDNKLEAIRQKKMKDEHRKRSIRAVARCIGAVGQAAQMSTPVIMPMPMNSLQPIPMQPLMPLSQPTIQTVNVNGQPGTITGFGNMLNFQGPAFSNY